MSRSRRPSRVAPVPRGEPPEPVAPAPPPEVAAPAVVSSSITLRGLSERTLVIILLAAATILRLAIAPWGRYLEDAQVLAFRSARLAQLPSTELYKTNRGVIDHLPGDLWFLWYISNLYHALAPTGNFNGDTFLYVTKLVPILADAGAALALYLLARELAGPKAGLIAAALYAFNPGPIVVAAIWDQWDAISACAALFALWFFLRRQYELAAVALTYASLVKPQFAMFGLLFAVVYARRLILPPLLARLHGDTARAPLRALASPLARAVAAIFAAWVTAEAVLLPFNVSVWPLSAQFDLRDRLRYVFRVHDETTLNAFNLWATPLAGNGVNDYQISFLGLTSRTWGQILFAAALLLILALWWRRGTDRAFVWAALAMTFSSFMLPTRIHERYLLPSVALAALIAAIQPRLLWFCAALTFTFSANVIAVYAMAHDKTGAPFFSRHDPWMTLASLANVALLIWLLARGLPATEQEAPNPSRRTVLRRGQLVRARR
jgi:dolichyl-phosphate-mannose-protein mannosyltransferase